MRLGELLEVISEYTYVDVVDDSTEKIIATHDGKNSIPSYLNDFEIIPGQIKGGSCVDKPIRGYVNAITVGVNYEFKLTPEGIKNARSYLDELKAKRKEILDAGKDIADTELPTLKDILDDVVFQGLDDDGEYYNGWAVTDNYDADRPICLKYGRDIVCASLSDSKTGCCIDDEELSIAQMFAHEDALTPAGYIKEYIGIEVPEVDTCAKLRSWLDANGKESVWDYPLSEVSEIVEHKYKSVRLVIDYNDGVFNCRYFEI